MKKLIFRYSAMNAGKSANLIMTYHNYRELGLKPVAVVPCASKNKKIYSRIGVEIEAIRFDELSDFLDNNESDCILVDEAQFLTKEDVWLLNEISIYKNITIICFGLRTTSTGELFDGAKHLFAIADENEELPTLCFCGKKAKMNIRAIDGKIDKSATIIKLRDEKRISYISVCRECFDFYYNKSQNSDISNLVGLFDNTKNTKKERN